MNRSPEYDQPRRRNPACSVCEDGDNVVVTLEMPGVDKSGLTVRIEGNELTIAGEVKDAETKGRYLLRERNRGSFRKHFTVDESIDREAVDATLADGILTLKLRIKEAAKPRQVEIK